MSLPNEEKIIFEQDAKIWDAYLNSDSETPVDEEKKIIAKKLFYLLSHPHIQVSPIDSRIGILSAQECAKKTQLNVAGLLSHGGRVMIEVPPLTSAAQDPNALFDWISGIDEGKKNISKRRFYQLFHTSAAHPIVQRSAATHYVANDRRKKLQEKRKARVIDMIKGRHYGMNVGLGRMEEGVVTKEPADGRNGHIYFYWKPPTKTKRGALLVGCENSAPGMTDKYGQKHDFLAKSGDISPTGVIKYRDFKKDVKDYLPRTYGGVRLALTQDELMNIIQIKSEQIKNDVTGEFLSTLIGSVDNKQTNTFTISTEQRQKENDIVAAAVKIEQKTEKEIESKFSKAAIKFKQADQFVTNKAYNILSNHFEVILISGNAAAEAFLSDPINKNKNVLVKTDDNKIYLSNYKNNCRILNPDNLFGIVFPRKGKIFPAMTSNLPVNATKYIRRQGITEYIISQGGIATTLKNVNQLLDSAKTDLDSVKTIATSKENKKKWNILNINREVILNKLDHFEKQAMAKLFVLQLLNHIENYPWEVNIQLNKQNLFEHSNVRVPAHVKKQIDVIRGALNENKLNIDWLNIRKTVIEIGEKANAKPSWLRKNSTYQYYELFKIHAIKSDEDLAKSYDKLQSELKKLTEQAQHRIFSKVNKK